MLGPLQTPAQGEHRAGGGGAPRQVTDGLSIHPGDLRGPVGVLFHPIRGAGQVIEKHLAATAMSLQKIAIMGLCLDHLTGQGQQQGGIGVGTDG